MPKSDNQKLKIFYILDYLQKNSHEKHPVRASELIEMLEREHNISCDRKTIYSDIFALTEEYGADIISIPGTTPTTKRTNINVNGIYKYTTQDPYVSNGEVMVTAKNLATFLGLGYYRTESGYKLTKDGKTFEIAGAGTDAKVNGANVTLPASAKVDGFQIFVPASAVAQCFGYEYSYDAAADTAYITTITAEGGAN